MHFFNRLFLVLFLLPLFSLAQSNYKAGYVVNAEGDTVRGFINYKQWDQNPGKIKFKSSVSAADAKTFTVKDIAAFAISGYENYQRFAVSVSNGPLDINKMESTLDTTFHTDTVFLRVCASGKKLTLYSFTDKIKQRFYYLENGGAQPLELTFQAHLNEKQNTVEYIRLYKSELTDIAQKLKVAQKVLYDISKIEYTEPELIKIMVEINGPQTAQFSQPSVSGSRWFVGVGGTASQLKFEGTANPFPNNKPTTVYSPKITFGLDCFPNKIVKRFFIRIEYSFEINKYNNSDANNLGYETTVSTLNFTRYNSTLTPQAVLNIFNNASFKFFISAGVGLNFAAYNHYQTVTSYPGTFAPPIYQVNYPALNGFSASLPLTAGFSIAKRVELNFRYVTATSITNYSSFSGSVTSYQFGINFLLGK
ncbi:PorT family protein [Mucilaginibacter sp. X4EP1]|uniref:PorT family protein n=1 Tax=Mucilaginibacter sp. X4EP1 TaxID=2723092 RepID=UPI0021677B24|nr:PorT family protein [Mucilaginibacter sp. X4EP1]MCS3814417.1 hypothetical protein [Mucilaginibacter sp. X4EP1]